MANLQKSHDLQRVYLFDFEISYEVRYSKKRNIYFSYTPSSGELLILESCRQSYKDRKSRYILPKGLTGLDQIHERITFREFLNACYKSPYNFVQFDTRKFKHPEIYGIHLANINRYWDLLKQEAINSKDVVDCSVLEICQK